MNGYHSGQEASVNEQSELIERLRALLSGEPSTREVSMFGGRSFMVNDKMVVSARTGGELLVQIGRAHV